MALTKVTRNLLSTGIDDQSNATAITIDSSENVGIGTSSINNPFSANTAAQIGDITEVSSLLTLAGTTQGSIYFADSTSGADRYAGYIDYNHSGNYMAFGGKGNGSEMVRIDSSGNVGIGTTSPSSYYSGADNLVVSQSSGEGGITIVTANNTYGNLYFADGTSGADAYRGGIIYGHSANNMNFYTNGNERIRINSSGHFLVGVTSYSGSTEGVKIENNGLYIGKSTTAIQHCARFENPNGEVGSIKTTGTSTQFNTSSDARLKDVTGSARGLEVINALNPVAFNWTTDGKSDEGLLAQEVQEIVPNAVSGSEEEYYQMDYSKLVTHLVAGMKEQQTLIEQLQAEVVLLKGE
jgi:hypothetical protein